MFAENNNLELLERHFAGKLTEEEQAIFDKSMKTDADFKELVGYFEDFMVGLEDFGDKAVLQELKSLEKTIQQEEKMEGLQNLWKGFFDKADYTLEQLAALFRPVVTYEPLLAHAHRGNDIPLIVTEKEWDMAVEDMVLTFSEPISSDFSLAIENNQRQVVWTSIIPEASIDFTLTLQDTNIQAPGRYYFKLSNDKQTLLQEFFVHKDWMPKP